MSKTLLTAFAILSLGLTTASSYAQNSMIEVQTTSGPYLLTVNEPSGDRAAAIKLCTTFYNNIVYSDGTIIASDCDQTLSQKKLQERKSSGKYKLHFDFSVKQDGSIRLFVENWDRKDDTDFTSNTWNIAPSTDDSQKTTVQKLLVNFFDFQKHQRAIKETLLAKAVLIESSSIGLRENGEYHDRVTGKKLEFTEAYREFTETSPKHKHFFQASLEILGLLGLESAIYWSNKDSNQVDWDYEFNWENFRKRFITAEAVSFDANDLFTNGLSHPYAGALYYGFARNNNFDSFESFLFGLAGSSMWEYLFEFKETVSINDQVFTTIGGAAIAEVIYQMSDFFNRSSNTALHNILAAVLGGPAKLNQLWNKDLPKRAKDLDSHGFPKDVWHKFQLFAGAGGTENQSGPAQASGRIGFDAEIIRIPEFGKPGAVSRVVTDTVFTKMLLESDLGNSGLQYLRGFLKAVFAGYYKQSIEQGINGELKGYSFLIGVGPAYDFTIDNKAIGDFAGIANVLGPTIELNLFIKGVHIMARLDVSGDVAMIRSYALDKYAQQNDGLWGLPSVLRKQKYYYAFGVTTAGELSASYKGFEVGGNLTFHYFHSINGHDRFQENVTRDPDVVDNQLTYRAWVAYTFPEDSLKLSLLLQRNMRTGTMGNVSDAEINTTVMTMLTYLF